MFHITNKGQHPEFNREGVEAADKIVEHIMLNEPELDPEVAQKSAEELMSNAELEPGIEFEDHLVNVFQIVEE